MGFFTYASTHEAFFKQNATLVKYNKGHFLVSSIDQYSYVYFLDKGLVKACFTLTDGSERLIGYFLSGMTFAQSGSFFQDSGGSLEYIVQEPSDIYRIERSKFLKQLTTESEFNAQYLDMVLRNQIFLIERIVYQGENGIENKFRRWLLFMAKYYGNGTEGGYEIPIKISQEDIASFLHVTRVSVNKMVKQHVDLGLMEIRKRCIYIPDIKNIQELL